MTFIYEIGPHFVVARTADGRRVRLGDDWFGVGIEASVEFRSDWGAESWHIDVFLRRAGTSDEHAQHALMMAALPGLLARYEWPERDQVLAGLTGHQRIAVAAERRRYLEEVA